MSWPSRFEWRDGDIELIKSNRRPTKEEIEHADKVIEDVIRSFYEEK